ncbi:aromatic ring-hydroxylating oxygenase subunit alpha [Streptomyces mirabilis]|uniref:aromatic ring-hydroxylating oxygenase subunit alpha n=1 Tax=Streptomyces mirabilis TaxID=68239 RepID=UPI0033B53B17
MKLGTTDGSIVNRHSFFDDEVFAKEAEAVFGLSWIFLAHESEIAAPGDYVTRLMGDNEVIVSRAEDGTVHVMLNSCMHRGVKLCAADMGNTSHFRCGYHGWTYGNDGRLRGVPQAPVLYPEGIDRKSRGLKEARTDIRYGLIFATFNGEIGDLEAEYGAEALWHLQTLVGKAEYEFYGPPVRAVGEFNWKSGAENWTGDGYHGEVTHRTVLGVGLVFDTESIVEDLIDDDVVLTAPDGNASTSQNQVTLPKGSALHNVQLPHSFNQPVFPGYEKHLWPEFLANLTDEQLTVADRRVAVVGTFFPNLGIVEDVLTVGDGVPPVNVMNLRLWRPVSSGETEIWSWLVVPKRASQQWKENAQRAFARSFNLGGMLELDDFHNWNSNAQANQGPVGMSLNNDYTAPAVEPRTDLPWPGSIYDGFLHDVEFRTFYTEWAARMKNAGAEFAEAEASSDEGDPSHE